MKCPGPLKHGDQGILFCNTCDTNEGDENFDKAHEDSEWECFKNLEGICVLRRHAGRACKTIQNV